MLALLLAVTPSPTPTPDLGANDGNVTPGVVGFLAFAFVVAAVVLLVLDMNRRIRRVRYRGELSERRAAAERDEPRDDR